MTAFNEYISVRGACGFWKSRHAASLVGYALVLGLVAILALMSVSRVGDEVARIFGLVGETSQTLLDEKFPPPETEDTTPNPFSFNDVVGAAPDDQVISNPVTISGITVPVPFFVTGDGNPLASVNDGEFVQSGMVGEGDQIRLRASTSEEGGETLNVTLNVNGVQDVWVVQTQEIVSSTNDSDDCTSNGQGFSLSSVPPLIICESAIVRVSGTPEVMQVRVTQSGSFSLALPPTPEIRINHGDGAGWTPWMQTTTYMDVFNDSIVQVRGESNAFAAQNSRFRVQLRDKATNVVLDTMFFTMTTNEEGLEAPTASWSGNLNSCADATTGEFYTITAVPPGIQCITNAITYTASPPDWPMYVWIGRGTTPNDNANVPLGQISINDGSFLTGNQHALSPGDSVRLLVTSNSFALGNANHTIWLYNNDSNFNTNYYFQSKNISLKTDETGTSTSSVTMPNFSTTCTDDFGNPLTTNSMPAETFCTSSAETVTFDPPSASITVGVDPQRQLPNEFPPLEWRVNSGSGWSAWMPGSTAAASFVEIEYGGQIQIRTRSGEYESRYTRGRVRFREPPSTTVLLTRNFTLTTPAGEGLPLPEGSLDDEVDEEGDGE